MSQNKQKSDLLYNLEQKVPQIQQFKNEMYNKTAQYQKELGFKIGTGKNATWNNEADAFKHAFMQAVTTVRYGDSVSNLGGLLHERNGDKYSGQPTNEENMDLWNNAVGREIGKEVKGELKGIEKNFTQKQIEDMVAVKIMQKIKAGKLITKPSDKRKYTGFAVDIDENKTYTREEIGNMTPEEFDMHEKAIMKQLKEKGIPTKAQAETKTKSNSSGNSSYCDGNWVTINGHHVILDK